MNMLKICLLLALYSTLEVTHAENATACEICGKPLPDEEASFTVSSCTTAGGCYIEQFFCLTLEQESNQPGADSCADYQANYTYDCCGITRAPVAPVTAAPFTSAPSFAPGNCSLCEDFSEPPSNCTYSDNEDWATVREDECAGVHAVWGYYCGCDNPSAETACRICDGPLPDPDKELQVDFCEEVGCFQFVTTCGFLEYEANFLGQEDQCNETQAKYAESCCSAPPATCEICGFPLPSPDLMIDFTVSTDVGPMAFEAICADFEIPGRIPILPEDCAMKQDMLASTMCCAGGNMTSEVGMTMAPVTSAPVTEMDTTSTAPVTMAPVMEMNTTMPPVTTAPVMMEMNMTIAPVTTPPVTSAPVTTAPVTTAPVTTAPVTTAPVINMTMAPVTMDMNMTNTTDGNMTRAPVTSAPIVALTSGATVYGMLVSVMALVFTAMIGS